MYQPKVLRPEDMSAIVQYERTRLKNSGLSEEEQELSSWHASWRKESLEHYLPLGWSFGLWDNNNEIKGYFLAQPQLFFRGMTQTLWIERLVADTPQLTEELFEIAYRICREKHFQKALLFLNEDVPHSNSIIQLTRVSDNLMEIKTAKF